MIFNLISCHKILKYKLHSFIHSFIFLRERGKEKEKHPFIVPFAYVFIGWFLFVPTIKPTILVYWDNAVTNWASGQGLRTLLQWRKVWWLLGQESGKHWRIEESNRRAWLQRELMPEGDGYIHYLDFGDCFMCINI